MLSAPAEETCSALVDRIAGVMAVNTLSAEAVLARVFSQGFLSDHLNGLGKSGKGNPAILAARIVSTWKPKNTKKRKSRGELASEAVGAVTAAADAAALKKSMEHVVELRHVLEQERAMREPQSAPTSIATGPRTISANHEPPAHHQPLTASVSAAPVGVGSRQGLPDLRSPQVEVKKTKSDNLASRSTYDVTDKNADVTNDGGTWCLSQSQDDLLTANWRMRRVVQETAVVDLWNPHEITSLQVNDSFDRRRFYMCEHSFLLRTKHFGVLHQRPGDFYQLTRQGVMYKVERGGCPLCCGDEIFLLTLEERGEKGGDCDETNKNDAMLLSMPGDLSKALPKHRLRMDNWIECHCSGTTQRNDEEVDVGYVMDGVGPRDIAAHLKQGDKKK